MEEDTKSEDLTTGEPQEEVVEDVEFETTTRAELVACSYNAILSVSDLDTGLMSKEDSKRKNRIIRKSLRIIDVVICELYDEIFDDDEE